MIPFLRISPQDSEWVAWHLKEHGWKQTSRRFSQLARLPEGKTGIEALAHAAAAYVPEAKRWAEGLGEANATNQFLRVYAIYQGLVVAVPVHVLDAFRRLGGQTA